MQNFLLIFTFFFTLVQSQEKTEIKLNNQNFKAGIGVVDMKKILAQSTAYQTLVDEFEERRKHRNRFTKQEDVVRDEESKL